MLNVTCTVVRFDAPVVYADAVSSYVPSSPSGITTLSVVSVPLASSTTNAPWLISPAAAHSMNCV